MIKLKYLYCLSLGYALLMVSCSRNITPQQNTLKTIPKTYNMSKDTSNMALISWREYFDDPKLIALIDTAILNNLDILITYQRIQASKAEVLYRRGMLLPHVDALVSANQLKLADYSAAWAGNEGGQYANGKELKQTMNDYFIGFQSSWELDAWGKLQNKKKAALYRYLSSIEGKNWIITNLVAEIADSYYNLLSLDNEIEIIRETIKLREDALSVVKIQKQVGVANALAVQQFEAQVLNLKSLEKETIQQITEMENKINFLLGRFPQQLDRNTNSFNSGIPSSILSGIPSQLLKNRPDIRQSEFELMASKADVKAAKAAFFPSINIVAGIGYDAFKPNYLFYSPQSIAYNILGGIAAPVLNKKDIKAEFTRANAFQLEALYNYQKNVIAAFVEVRNELSSIQNLQDIYALRTEEVSVLSKAVETSSDLFKTGRATYLEVLLAQENALDARFELTDTKYKQYHSIINIYKALGGGWR